MPKALLYMQVHVCVMGVGGGIHVCAYAKVAKLSTVYLVRPKAHCSAHHNTHTSLHTRTRDVPHTPTYAHTHCAGHLHTSLAQHMHTHTHTWSMHPDMPTLYHKQPSMILNASVSM